MYLAVYYNPRLEHLLLCNNVLWTRGVWVGVGRAADGCTTMVLARLTDGRQPEVQKQAPVFINPTVKLKPSPWLNPKPPTTARALEVLRGTAILIPAWTWKPMQHQHIITHKNPRLPA